MINNDIIITQQKLGDYIKYIILHPQNWKHLNISNYISLYFRNLNFL